MAKLVTLFCLVYISCVNAEFQSRKPLPIPPEDIKKVKPLVVPETTIFESRTLSSGVHVFIKRYKFIGNTVVSSDELANILHEFTGKRVMTSDLAQVRNLITQAYIDRGYINSGAVIPDQEVKEGVILVEITEGVLTDIHLTGMDRLRDSYILERISLDVGPPLNIGSLQKRLQLLHQDERIKTIKAELVPGSKRGEGYLNVDVMEAAPFTASLEFSNHRSPSVGSDRLQLGFRHINVTGRGDTASVRIGNTSGLDDLGISYSLPITPEDMTIEIAYDRSNSGVVEEPFNLVDVNSKFESARIFLNYPQIADLNERLNYGFTVERRHSMTYLFGSPYSFSDGVNNGKSTVSALRFSQDWTKRTKNTVWAVKSMFSFGLNAFGATTNQTGPDGRFASWLGQFQWVERMNKPFSRMIARLDTQLTNYRLLPLEKFVIGGVESVRGYRQNQLVRDNGLTASIEFRIPLLSEMSDTKKLELATYVDYGRAWDTSDSATVPSNISSVGIGLLWKPAPVFDMELYFAKKLRNIDKGGVEYNLQDSGIHFMMRMKLF